MDRCRLARQNSSYQTCKIFRAFPEEYCGCILFRYSAVRSRKCMSTKPEEQPTPYQLPQPAGMASDLVHLGVLKEWLADDKFWVPTTDSVAFRPLMFNVSQGYYINLLRVRGGGFLSRHRHSGPVHALVLKGRW